MRRWPKRATSSGIGTPVPRLGTSFDWSTTTTNVSAADATSFLPEKCTACAFDQIEFGIDLIGTIHGDVDRVLRQLLSRDPRLAALSRRDVRGRDTYHVRQPTVAETDPQLLDEIPGRGAAAQANGHPALDKVGGRYSGDPFLLFTPE